MRLLLTLLLGFSTAANAANLCVTASGAGSANGADWNNALSASFTPVRGNTYYLADGAYGSKNWSTANSGSTWIIIKKATASAHGSETGWVSTMGDGAATFNGGWTVSSDYWELDGVTGGGPESWDSGYGITMYSTDSGLIVLSGTRNNIIHSRISLESDRGATTDPSGTTGNGYGAGIKGTTGSGNNLRFSRMAIKGIYGACFHFSNWSNVTNEYLYVYHNRNTPAWHSEGVSCIGNNDNITWRWSIWDRIEGTAVFAGVNFGQSTNWKIYGNVLSRLVGCPPLRYYSEPPYNSNDNEMYNSLMYNNTIYDSSGTLGTWTIDQGSGNVSLNNLWYNNDYNAFYQSPTHNYNFASDNIRSEDGPFDKDSEILDGEANGQNSSGSPFTSYNANPLLANLAAETTAGSSLSSPYNVDMFGNVRGADGTWDRGAIEYGGGPPPEDPAVIVSEPSAVTNTAAAGFTLTVSASGTGTILYQWRREGTNIPSATSASYSVIPATTNHSGNYSVFVTNNYGSDTSVTVYVSVVADAVPGLTNYVKSSASGTGNGSDWSNAMGWSFTPVRGSLYYIADGVYAARSWSTANAGTTNITIRKATAADHGTSTGWSSDMGDGEAVCGAWTFSSGYWIFDGQWRTATSSNVWDGAVIDYGFHIQATGGAKAIRFNNGSGNSSFSYVDAQGSGSGSGVGDDVVYTLYDIDNITLSSCSLRDSDRTIFLLYGAPSDWLVEKTFCGRNNSTVAIHGELLSCVGLDNLTFRNNIVEDTEGTTAAFFVGNSDLPTKQAGNTASGWKIYGNVFRSTAGYSQGISYGLMFVANDAYGNTNWMDNLYFANNTTVNLNIDWDMLMHMSLAGTGNVVINNVFYDNTASAGTGDPAFLNMGTLSYNWYYNTASTGDSGTGKIINTTDYAFYFFAPSSLDMRLVQALAGTALASEYNTDMFGNTRGSDGVWDRGAYEYTATSGVVPSTVNDLRVNNLILTNAP